MNKKMMIVVMSAVILLCIGIIALGKLNDGSQSNHNKVALASSGIDNLTDETISLNGEKFQFFFDNQGWHLGYDNKVNYGLYYEYLPKGDNIDEWKQLISVQVFTGLQERFNSISYANGLIEKLKQSVPKGFYYDEIKNGRNSANDFTMHWKIDDPTNTNNKGFFANQYVIVRIIVGKNSLFVLQYATKVVPVTKQEMEKWTEIIQKATLVK